VTDKPFSPLVADIITAQFAMSRQMSQTLIDSLTAQNDEHLAELAAVRDGITRLLAGPYQPSASAILNALYPTDAVIARYRPEVTS
jgi:hypothetical protein